MADSSTIILCKKARVAAEDVAALTTAQKNDALGLIADALEAHMADILAANYEDIAAATGNIPDVLLDRLKLTEDRVRGMAAGIRARPSASSPSSMRAVRTSPPTPLPSRSRAATPASCAAARRATVPPSRS